MISEPTCLLRLPEARGCIVAQVHTHAKAVARTLGAANKRTCLVMLAVEHHIDHNVVGMVPLEEACTRGEDKVRTGHEEDRAGKSLESSSVVMAGPWNPENQVHTSPLAFPLPSWADTCAEDTYSGEVVARSHMRGVARSSEAEHPGSHSIPDNAVEDDTLVVAGVFALDSSHRRGKPPQ